MAGPELTQPPATQWRGNCARMEQRARKDAIPSRLILESFIGYEWMCTTLKSLSLERS